MLTEGVARYENGICEIRVNNKSVLRLPVHNTLFARKDAGYSSYIPTFSRSNGNLETFIASNGEWSAISGNNISISQLEDVWEYKDASGSIERFNSSGKIELKKLASGQWVSFHYDTDNRLVSVTDEFDDSLVYEYNAAGLIERIVTPSGPLTYSYDASGHLISVTYPDDTKRLYHYEDTSFPDYLTGISDEKAVRYATWAYDDKGRAIVSEHANGAERVEFAFNPDGTTTVIDANAAVRSYHFTVQQGQMKVDYIEGDRCATCANGGIKSYTYDASGFVASRIDWNGNVTTYTRDAQGRELSSTEGTGTPEARTVTTTWDADLNKPLVITEPERIIEYHYTPEGRLLSREERSRS